MISQSVVVASTSCPPLLSHLAGTDVHIKWPQLVLKLAPLLGVDVDFLMRHYVVELYTSGLDKIAQEVNNACVYHCNSATGCLLSVLTITCLGSMQT